MLFIVQGHSFLFAGAKGLLGNPVSEANGYICFVTWPESLVFKSFTSSVTKAIPLVETLDKSTHKILLWEVI